MHTNELLLHINKKYVQGTGQAIPAEQAWYSYPLLEYLEEFNFSKDTVFEYGSGISTVYWSRKARFVYSVEHDLSYYSQAIELKNKFNIPNIAIKLRSDTSYNMDAKLITSFLGDLSLRESEFLCSQQGSRNQLSSLSLLNLSLSRLMNSGSIACLASDYLFSILGDGDKFDIVIVDGMNRCLSGLLAMKRVKDNGIIIFDNSDRPMYWPLKNLLQESGFQEIGFTGPGPLNQYTWRTSLYVRQLEALRTRGKLDESRDSGIWF